MRKAITLCLLLMLVMPVCFAVDLDASALKPVTIRSEFQRGYDAVWRSTCGNLPTSTIDKIIGASVIW